MSPVDPYKFEKAKQRVIKLKQFYEHLIMFIIVSLGLSILNYYQNGWKNPWFLWALVSWGVGVGFHALFTFGQTVFFGSKWEEKKIKEFLSQQEKSDRWE